MLPFSYVVSICSLCFRESIKFSIYCPVPMPDLDTPQSYKNDNRGNAEAFSFLNSGRLEVTSALLRQLWQLQSCISRTQLSASYIVTITRVKKIYYAYQLQTRKNNQSAHFNLCTFQTNKHILLVIWNLTILNMHL